MQTQEKHQNDFEINPSTGLSAVFDAELRIVSPNVYLSEHGEHIAAP